MCNHRILTRVGGLDISFVKDHPEKAYCTLVILSIPNLNVIYEDSFEVQLTAPYIAGKLLEYLIMQTLNLKKKYQVFWLLGKLSIVSKHTTN